MDPLHFDAMLRHQYVAVDGLVMVGCVGVRRCEPNEFGQETLTETEMAFLRDLCNLVPGATFFMINWGCHIHMHFTVYTGCSLVLGVLSC